MKLVPLREAALKAGIERRQFKRRIRILERDPALHGIPIIVSSGGKDWVKLHILELLHTRELHAITSRIDAQDARLTSVEYRVDALEAG